MPTSRQLPSRSCSSFPSASARAPELSDRLPGQHLDRGLLSLGGNLVGLTLERNEDPADRDRRGGPRGREAEANALAETAELEGNARRALAGDQAARLAALAHQPSSAS
jgi:hypothetical protein